MFMSINTNISNISLILQRLNININEEIFNNNIQDKKILIDRNENCNENNDNKENINN